jgi:hypothetical protein
MEKWRSGEVESWEASLITIREFVSKNEPFLSSS